MKSKWAVAFAAAHFYNKMSVQSKRGGDKKDCTDKGGGRIYTAFFILSLIESEIIAINSPFVGFPLLVSMV